MTLNALLYGLVSALALGTLILIFAALNAAVGYEELLRLLPGPLTGLGVTMTVALGFLPQTIAALGEVREAQAVRGHTARRGVRGGRWAACRRSSCPCSPSASNGQSRSRRRWRRAASAYRATGGVRTRRTAYRARPWRTLDSAVVAGAGSPAVVIALVALGGSALIYYPYPVPALAAVRPTDRPALLPLLLPRCCCRSGEWPTPGPSRRGRGAIVGVGSCGTATSAAQFSPPDREGLGGRLPLARLDHVTYAYPRAPFPSLMPSHGICLMRETVLLVGASGAGKSTLLRTFNGLVPHFTGGRFGGTATVAGLRGASRRAARDERRRGDALSGPGSGRCRAARRG